MIDMITLSSKGQIVIPKSMREAIGLKKDSKFLITHQDDSIILKKVSEDDLKFKMKTIMKAFAKEFNTFSKEELRKEIKASRG